MQTTPARDALNLLIGFKSLLIPAANNVVTTEWCRRFSAGEGSTAMTVIFPFAGAGGSATSTTEAETTLLKALRQAHAFIARLQKQAAQRSGSAADAVVVSLSAEAAQLGSAVGAQAGDLVAQWREALTDRQKADENGIAQLTELSKQMRRSRHDQALQRLQQLLAQYRALRMLGASSAKALAALAKEIKAAANELAAGGDSGESSTDTSGSVVATASAAGTAGVTADIVAAASAGADAARAGPGAADTAAPAASAGGPAKDTTASVPGDAEQSKPSPSQARARQLIAQAEEAGARARQHAQDDLLLQQARAALGDIARLAKQVDDEKQRKGMAAHATADAAAGKSGILVRAPTGLDVIV